MNSSAASLTGQEVAIVGMAGRFPGAGGPDELWRNLRAGVRSITRFSEEEMAAAGVSAEELRSPGYVPAAGVVEGVELFDAAFFGFSPREALVLNPQQRLFLECAWEALERAGYASGTYRGRIGVYASEGQNNYLFHVLSQPELVRAVGDFQVMLSNTASVATLASYKLDLEGPSLSVQTACSSSLVAVHLACQALVGAEADLALAGGVRISVPQRRGYHAPPGGILSPTGECSPFDADASGSVAGSGVGVVALKRLEDALRDGDAVHAVIRGSAVNNDGARKVGFTAPRREGQAAVVAEALAVAGVEPGEVSYVETHGSGTAVGDPIEVAALATAYGEGGRPGSCALGAVKSSVGHLDAAAGVVGLIKTALALEHGEIPPSPYFRRANPKIDFERSPFFVNPELRPWERNGAPRRAGVSSFGMGGTNAHVVLEEAPELPPSGPSRPWQLLVLSARTPAALEAATDRLAEHLRAHPEQELADAAHTLRVGRRRFPHRRVLVCRGREDAVSALKSRDARRLLEGAQEREERPVAFLFPGVGDHYPQMARGLYESEPVFRREVDRCAEVLLAHTGTDVRAALFPGEFSDEAAAGATVDLRAMLGRDAPSGEDPLSRTELAHPAVFTVEYALARLWTSWGVRPEAMIGHSLGEYVAATVAGVFPLEDALALLAERARLIAELPAGAMLAVPLDPPAVEPLLRDGLALAAHNAPGLCTVSGPAEAVAALEAELAAQGAACRRLNAEHAFHSPAMEPVAERLAERLRAMRLRAPEVPFVSNVTGTWIRAEEAADPEYWARHLCRTVRFAEGVAELLGEGSRVLLEVGPGRSLGSFALHAGAAEEAVFASLRHAYTRQADPAFLLETLGRLWIAGVRPDWGGFAGEERRRRVPLPTYPFERQRYWVELAALGGAAGLLAGGGAAPEPAEPAAPEPSAPGEPLPGLQPRPETGTRYVAPRGEVEERMAAVWRDLLGFERIGVHDDFFALGGHSLLATHLVSRVQDEFRVAVSLDAVFDVPTVAGLAEKVAGLRAADRPREPVAIRPAPRTAPLPLSFGQERIWALDRMEPGNPMHNVPVAGWLRGPLDAAVARRALTEVFRRHEVLRTVYAEVDGAPVQVVRPPCEVPLPVDDASGVAEAEHAGAARRLLDEEARRPIDLSTGPVVRARLLRFGPELHLLLLTMHHIVMDGWSGGVIFYEMQVLYNAFSAGDPSPLPELPIQYADYAAWQREQLSGERLEEHLAFWREALRGVPPVLELPTDRPHPPVQTHRGGLHGIVFAPELVEDVRALAHRERTTFHLVLVAAFQALLFRYTGQEDFAVGSLAANRVRPETQQLIGFFINTLPLRARPAGRLRFHELVGRVKEWMVGAYAHAEVPLQMILDEVRPERDPSRNPLVQVMLGIQAPSGDAPVPERASGMVLEQLGDAVAPTGDSGTSKFDLSLLVAEGDVRSTTGVVEYNSDLFDLPTVERFLGHFRLLLEAVAAAPDTPLAEIPLLAPEERRQLLEDRAGAPASAPERRSLHEAFAAQAARTPGATALVRGAERVSYAALEARADRVAGLLRRMGVGPETRVGVCLERTPELVAALLGVLRAGGAYVPLDPEYPAERLALMLDDSGAAVVVTQDGLADRLPPTGAAVLRVDGGAGDEAGSAGERPGTSCPAAPDNLAYVIYTSGTTGRPKGVAVPHRSALALLRWAEDEFAPAELAGVLASTSVCFDLSVFELFVPLCLGGTVVLAESALDLLDLPAGSGVTLVNTVPSAMAEVVRAGGVPAGIHAVNLAGEPLPARLAAEVHARGGVRLRNLYGPTEDTVYSTCARVPAGAPAVTIGRAVAGTRAYVLDAELNPVPAGVPGALYLAGEGLARGYLGRAELSAERFVPCPFGEPGGRMYATGDRVRRLASGELEFLGRVDQQVKVRGFRIEPAEVEGALLRDPRVRECVVVARDDPPGDRRLAAYLVAAPGGLPAHEELAARLRASLPEYMVPSAFVEVEALPLTPNGKVDRRALPAPGGAAAEAYAPPRSPAEEVLCGIWAEVLQVERVGVHDSFFELGGHSLLANRVAARAAEALGAELPIRAVFEARTVAGLAERAEALLRAGPSASAPPVLPAPRDGGPLPLSFAQQRLWVVDRIAPGSPAYNIPFALRLRGSLDEAALRGALDALVRRHETLRTTFRESGGTPAQVVHPPARVPLPAVELRALSAGAREAEARRLARAEALRPFDLARGPLLRASLLGLDADDHVLCFTLHHVVSDGWSMEVLVREVSALYGAFGRGDPSPLPPLPVQYADFALWQRSWLSGEVLAEQLGYWKERLAGAPPLLDLPVDRPRTGRGGGGACRRFAISAETSRGLRALARREGATLFMTLLAGWQALLGRYACEDDVVVGSPSAARTRPEVEGLIGFFVNMLPLRTDLSGDPTWTELLGRVRESALGAYAHQELPFERLVEEVATDRSLLHPPVFQVALDLQRPPAGERPRLGEVEIEPFTPGTGAAKFELDLVVVDAGDGLDGELVYLDALFEAATAERIVAHLGATLEAMAAEPERRLSGLSLLGAAERAQVLDAWNETAAELPSACVHELFAEQAARTPGAPAVVAADRTLTYAELDRAANRLAHHLRGLGVGPERRVGVCMERGAGLVVALLGVLKAGGVYLPLDPGSPPGRLEYVLADARAAALVAGADLADALAAFGGARVDPERDLAAIEGAGDEAPAVALSPENAAYVIYTSGSTGAPKGVEVTHAGAANLLPRAVETFGAGPGSRVLQTASIGFDASLLEVFVALLSGAALHAVGREAVLSPYRLGAALREREVDVWVSTPALLDMLPHADFPALRTVSTGGERCSAETAARWSAGRRLLNMYGPTETTVYVTAHACDPGAAAAPPIGRPVANARVYVLDAWGGPLPAGVPGEAYVGGAGVARGYLDRPALTAERFLPDPFSGEPGARLYRTGDRARWLPAGELEFLGRVDQQVKIRGVRVEPGEVEAVLTEHPWVREAVVVPYEESPGRRRLVAYLVPGEGEPVSRAELRERLRARLPEPLVPASFVTLDALPRTPAGKVDRRALPAPRLSGETEYVAPRTPAEQLLCGIYAEVLGIERVGVNDSFFDLGGHSLLATRVVSRVAETFGVEVPLRTVFEAPSVATLAERLQSAVPEAGVPGHDLEGEIARIAGLSDEEVLRLIEEG